MLRKSIIYLAIAGTAVIICFQLYTMYNLIFKYQATVANEEDIVVRQVGEEDERIAFTCNVDWGEQVLPDMLGIFKDNNLKITFFVSGKWAEKNPDLLREMYIAGHEIQNHGYSHKLCSQISASEVREEIKKTEAAVMECIGVKTNIFAPPAGDYDKKTIEICIEENYILSLWSIDTIDWRPGSTADIIENRVLNKNLKGGIVLMHPKEETVKALPSIIKKIEDEGIAIVSLSELINLKEL